MSLIAKYNSESSFTPVPPGMHLARCYRIVDKGTQKSEYQGQIKYLQKVMIQFEVHGEDDQGKPLLTNKGEPLSISKNYTLILAERATLRKDLASWRGRDFTNEELRGFELKNVLGVWGMISVSMAKGNNGKDYTNIMSINPVPAAIKKNGLPEGFNTTAMFTIENPDMELFETFSNGLREIIKSSPEWQARDGLTSNHQVRQGTSIGDMDDDIPF
jgi:hypothetical protein